MAVKCINLSTGSVRLEDAEWPVVASSSRRREDGYRVLSVREHEDGRVIVYGLHEKPDGNGVTDGDMLPTAATDAEIDAAVVVLGQRLEHPTLLVDRVRQQLVAKDV